MSTASTNPGEYSAQGVNKRDWIAGLEKGLSIIESFDDAHPRLTATQAAQRCGLTRTAARRYLITLSHLGYVGTDGKLFWLTPRVMRLGQAYLESARLPRIVQPFLQRLTAGTQEASYVCVPDGDDIIYVARNGSSWGGGTGFLLGARVSAHVTAAGMLLLAMKPELELQSWLSRVELKPFTSHTTTDKAQLQKELSLVRTQGWSLSEQKFDLAYRGVAVPLRDRKGDLVAALSVSMPIRNELAQEALQRVLPLLRETAQNLRHLI